ncbi:MAG: sodium:solute symporter [Oscillospiraceae bacterium]|jgi:SSS family solute:Na+ symporter|nr:sodium:solute symporter [Oscillospiraceae bacterium]
MSIIAITVLYILFVIGVGVYFTRKSKTVTDFVLGGMTLGPWITAFAYGNSYFSAVVFVGFAGRFGWAYGLSAVWIGLANAFIGSLAAWAVMGRRTRAMTRHFKSATMPDFFEKRYLSKTVKIISAAIVFVFLIPYTASIYNGLSRLFAMAFGTGEGSYYYFVIGMAIVTAVYVILGGYKATAYNDFFQGIIMIVSVIAIVFAILNLNGGFAGSIIKLSEIENEKGGFAGMNGAFVSLFGPDPINLVAVAVLTSLGTWGLPQMVHKFYTIKDERSIKPGMVISTAFAVIIAGGCYFLGSFGRIFAQKNEAGAPVNGFDDIVPSMLERLPELLLGVVVVLVLSASMSSLAGLVLTSSSTLTLDMIRPFAKKPLDEKKILLIMRFFIGVFILASVIIALNKNNLITDLMGYSWGALAGAFLAPFLYGLFFKWMTRAAVYFSFMFAVGLTALHLVFKPTFSVFGFGFASSVNLGAFIMVANLILVPLICLITPKLKKDDVESMFLCHKGE